AVAEPPGIFGLEEGMAPAPRAKGRNLADKQPIAQGEAKPRPAEEAGRPDDPDEQVSQAHQHRPRPPSCGEGHEEKPANANADDRTAEAPGDPKSYPEQAVNPYRHRIAISRRGSRITCRMKTDGPRA